MLDHQRLPWNVEENGLKEEGEADPLVVFVVPG